MRINLKNSVKAYAEMLESARHLEDVREFRFANQDSLYYKTREEKALDTYNDRMNAFDESIPESLKKALDDAQKGCRVRTINVINIIEMLNRVEQELSIPKKALNGVSVNIDLNAQSFPNAYRGIPESTQFSAEYLNGSWRITSIGRYKVCAPSYGIVIHHTEDSRIAILNRFSNMAI